MDDRTGRFALPLLAAGQAQKEVAHNEALALIDLALGAVAETIGEAAPPADPVPGRCWIVGEAPVGDWEGHAGALAGWTDGGWRFVGPVEGMVVHVRALDAAVRRTPAGWTGGEVEAAELRVGGVRVVGRRQPAIPMPVGGGTVDAQARATLGTVLSVLQSHGLIAP